MRPLVRIVDDEASVREARLFLFTMEGIDAAAYGSAEDFLERDDLKRPGVLVLDLRMPGMTGLELQAKLCELGSDLPVLFVSGHGDVNAAVLALKRGAFDFLEKPVDPDKLLRAVRRLVAWNLEERARKNSERKMVRKMRLLTPREREVADLMTEGLQSKVIAARLGLSEQTVRLYRSSLYRKLDVRTALEASDFLRKAKEAGKANPADLTRALLLSETAQGG